MGALRDNTIEHRYEQDFADTDGKIHLVYADYADEEGVRFILHVEAASALRGKGAASLFMKALSEHARAQHKTLCPICGYARSWYDRHSDYADILTVSPKPSSQ